MHDRRDSSFTAPMRTGGEAGPVRASAPVLTIDLSELALSMRRADDLGGHRGIDLSCDAWGLGLDRVLPIAVAEGIRRVRVDPSQSGLRDSLGLEAIDPEQRVPGVEELVGAGTNVLTLVGRVLSAKSILRGEGVSYGHLHHAECDGEIALVTGGYAQGILRALGSRGHVAVRGEPVPIVGRVAMDVCVLDVTGIGAAVGDEVRFLGNGVTLSDWARLTGWCVEDILPTLSARTRKEIVS